MGVLLAPYNTAMRLGQGLADIHQHAENVTNVWQLQLIHTRDHDR